MSSARTRRPGFVRTFAASLTNLVERLERQRRRGRDPDGRPLRGMPHLRVRSRRCRDCAFRHGSPESTEPDERFRGCALPPWVDPPTTIDMLRLRVREHLDDGRELVPFRCHQQMVAPLASAPAAYVHADGDSSDTPADDYDVCAGWSAMRDAIEAERGG